MGIIIFDIETNSKLVDNVNRIHTAAFAYEESFTTTACKDRELKKVFSTASAIGGHNIVRYDLPVLQKLGVIEDYYLEGYTAKSKKTDKPLYHVIDTLLFSRLLYPENDEHGLEFWGKQLGIEKPKVEDWEGQEEEVYEHRCKEDVRINSLLWEGVKAKASSVEKAYTTEVHFADIIAKQVRNGFYFDTFLARHVCKAIDQRMEELAAAVQHLMPETEKTKGELNKLKIPSTKKGKNGKYHPRLERFCTAHEAVFNPETGFIELNDGRVVDPEQETHLPVVKRLTLKNTKGVKAYLISLGWQPEYWNYKKDRWKRDIKINGEKIKASPKLRMGDSVCLSLVGMMSASDEKKLIVKSYLAYSVYKHRLSSLQGMLKQERLKRDRRISADMNTLGADTGRVTHKVVANIPKTLNEFDDYKISIPGVAESKHLMRACFRAPPNRILVGIDASALEARVEGHYVYKYEGGPEYSKKLLASKPHDIHTVNAAIFKVKRDLAKSIKYALSYGAGPGRIKLLLGCDDERAKQVYDAYWKAAPCVLRLMQDLEQQWLNNNRHIRALDGRLLFVEYAYKRLNYVCQSAGTIIMKKAACIMDIELRKEGLYRFDAVKKVCDYHDEFQFECDLKVKGLARHVGNLGVESIKKAGVELGLNVPLDGEFKIGKHWGMTH